MDALSILTRINSELSTGSTRGDRLQPRTVADLELKGKDELFAVIHCGGIPDRYDSTTVIVLHAKRNVSRPTAPENSLLDEASTWPNATLNASLLSLVDDFIDRIPRLYDTATRITMATDRNGVTDYTFEEEFDYVPFYPEALQSTRRTRTALITDLTKSGTLGPFADVVVWRGERVVFNRIGTDCESFVQHIEALKKRSSQRFVRISAIVIDARELLRGYIVPFYSTGNLAKAFLGSDGGRPSSSFVNPALKQKWGQQLAEGVVDAHASGITIGNLCPSHVLITETDDLVIDDLSGTLSDRSRPWSAPEVLSSRREDYASDIYSLGALLWAIAVGSSNAALWSGAPANVQERWVHGSAVPPWFRQVVDLCMEVNPAQRPGAPVVLEALAKGGNGGI